MRTLHEVMECERCPLEDAYGHMHCMHPGATRGLTTTREAPPPDECPLRKGELLITLRVER